MSNDWDTLISPAVPWRDAYARVETEARAILAAQPTDAPMSTNALVAWLQSPNIGDAARKRLYKALNALATRGLADCATRGEPVERKFGTIRPWLWHRPAPRAVCTGCGRPL